ncbi:heptaprenyl diphosphate synthase component I [Gracilibacillus boraciitolerans JCM 21714]|uniref:Heptaprenyl diphosphate synthase component I n=1 Tax=Gracilibacillus boraciitolerans JCM 21714 TaxID=1298598 RepID=W4VDU4_9BACI|nr:heptaprenyl diphosphate synthase component 1 [Gracilibacillus boraciitolerans]GAE91361.1 heptaprenyl diphosphate synthase component I [Gracilibacillus boraciitolerans JCM 21714]
MKYIEVINHYNDQIKESIKQVYLQQHLEQPQIEEHKIVALHLLAQTTKNHENLVLTTMLVQIALNTHDQISTQYEDNINSTQQQLTVLAGDYYSGIYYHLLANSNDLSLISVLADGINEMTQEKMHVYYNDYHTIKSFLDDFEKIESKLVIKIANFVNKDDASPYISKWLMYKRIEFELVQLSKNHHTFFHQLLKETVQNIHDSNQIENSLILCLEILENELLKLKSDKWMDILDKDLDIYPIHDKQKNWKIMLEEGLSQ